MTGVILGIGVDIIKISRVEALLTKNKQRFLQRILTKNELDLLDSLNNSTRFVSYIAKRFAAKEAFAKALGTGIGEQFSFQDIEIASTMNGKPYFNLSNELRQKHHITQTHLSMSDEKEYAQAFVIIEK